MTQTTLWLLPLALGALFGIINAARMGLRWSWGLVIQHTIVLVISLCGLYVIPRWDWLCAYLGWGFMLSYTVVARMILMKMTQALGLLRIEKAVSNGRVLRLIMWGPPGRFWLDLAFMINLYLRSDTKAADAIYKKWIDFGIPRFVSDSLTAYAMIGLLVMRDWNTTTDKFEEARSRFEAENSAGKTNVKFPLQIAIPAARAFNELGRFKEGSEALALADLPSSGYSRESLETIFLSYFALLGAKNETEQVLQSMEGNKASLPEYARLYWKARCATVCLDYENAILIFAESLRKTPDKDSAWKERTQQQMKNMQDMMHSAAALQAADNTQKAVRAEAARNAMNTMKRCFLVADILSSRRPPTGVRVLTGVISVMFIYSSYPMLMREKSSFAFDYGYLAANMVFAGQWWRLVTYLFLHGGISHLFMNLFGLIWFGRFVENIFGTWRFLIIFFLSGILSGALQIALSAPDDKAVGASGAILGIFGAGLAATLRLKDVLPAQLRRHELSWMIALAVTQLVFDQVVNFLFPASSAAKDAVKIAAAAHFGGMISGFAIGWILPLRKLGTEE